MNGEVKVAPSWIRPLRSAPRPGPRFGGARPSGVIPSLLLGLLVLIPSCSDPAAPQVPTSLRLISGDDQTGTVGETLSTPLVVEVADQRERPMEGVTVQWSSSAGSFSSSTVTTDADGRAEVTWTLGTDAGTASATARVSSLPSVAFTAQGVAGPVAALALTGPAEARGGDAVALTLSATDQYGNVSSEYEGHRALVFSGASPAPDGTPPTVEDESGSPVALEATTTISFTAGEASTEAVLYAAEVADLEVTDETFASPPLTVDVAPGATTVISVTPVEDSVFATFTMPLEVASTDGWDNSSTEAETFTWSSSGDAASVDADGVVTGVDTGRVTVTVSASTDVQAGATITVDRFVQISAGGRHTCAVSARGSAYCWGDNTWGQLGDGLTEDRSVPARVTGSLSWTLVTAGYDHTCGLTPGAEAYCWGNNDLGQRGDGSFNQSSVPAPLSPSGEWARLSAGNRLTCGITTTSAAYCWGSGGHGQRGDGSFESVSTVPSLVEGGHSWSQVSAQGAASACGTTLNGAAYCWGDGQYGQRGDGGVGDRLAVPSPVSGDREWLWTASGSWHACGLSTTHDLYCWGNDENGELGDGDATAGSAVPSPVAGDREWASVTSGAQHGCGLTSAGDALCWGSAGNAQLGNGSTSGLSTIPSLVSGDHEWAELDVDGGHSCGLTTAGGPFCWGANGAGQLGSPGTFSAEPAKISPP